MRRLLLLPLLKWARRLRHPTLFKLTAAAFAISVLWPFDPIPLIDELVLGLATLWLGSRRSSPPDDSRTR
jgi:hypothetical protein